MKFKSYRKGRIMYGVGGGLGDDDYVKTVGHPHTGVDWTVGFGVEVRTDNAGFVYKVCYGANSPSNWQAVYLLVPYKDHWMEVCLGHLSTVIVREGEWVKENQLIGFEGNFGEVYSGGQLITKAMQLAGDRRASHVHEQYRPVKKVRTRIKGRHYLWNENGSIYRDSLGFSYEIMFDNAIHGCIDPLAFTVESPKAKLEFVSNTLDALNKEGGEALRQLIDFLIRNRII